MADMHVLDASGNNSWRVAMHFAVPDVNNAVGINYRSAIVASGLGGTTLLPDGDGTDGTISAAEKTNIESGTIVEHVASFRVESGGTSNVELRDSLREFYAAEETKIINDLKHKLRYFGHTEAKV